MSIRTKAALTIGIGSISALGTYIFFSPKLRKELQESKTALEAAEILGTHMRDDAMGTVDLAIHAVQHTPMVKQAAKKPTQSLKHAVTSAKRTIKKNATHARTDLKKAVAHAK